MPIKLRPNEMAFYPAPFVETEANLLVVTNQRVVHFGDAGLEEVAARDLSHAGRLSRRPTLAVGVIAAVLALPLIGLGAWLFLTSAGAPAIPGLPAGAAAPATPAPAANDDPAGAPANDDPAGAAPAEGAAAPSNSADTRLVGVALALPGLLLLVAGALLVRREEHLLILRAGTRIVTIKARDKMQQTLLLSTVQAVQGGAKGVVPAAATAAPRVQVDDKGDPVKALQDLASARQSGKISDEDFVARREVLLERINARK